MIITVGGGTGGSTHVNGGQSFLGADVPMLLVAVNGPSVTLAQGVYAIDGEALVLTAGGGGTVSHRIWDGTNTYSTSYTHPGATDGQSTSLPPFIVTVPSGGLTFTLQAICSVTGATLKAASIAGFSGNFATSIRWLQLQ